MKVKLLKDHLGHKAGDQIEVTPERANYFKLVGLVKGEGVPYSGKEKTVVKEKKAVKLKKEKKDKAGPNAPKKK